MTIEEKKKRIRAYCKNCINCDDCELSGMVQCYDTNDDAIISKNYHILFGDEERIEQNKKPMNVSIEDADTMIVIKSNRKIDNITIYFKED